MKEWEVYHPSEGEKAELIEMIIRERSKGGSMKAVLCPVCNGVGQVSGGFYDRAGDCPIWVSNKTTEPCRSCNGRGWVEVSEGEPMDIVGAATGEKQQDRNK